MISRMITIGEVTVVPDITFNVFVVFADPIYARGLQASLAELSADGYVLCHLLEPVPYC